MKTYIISLHLFLVVSLQWFLVTNDTRFERGLSCSHRHHEIHTWTHFPPSWIMVITPCVKQPKSRPSTIKPRERVLQPESVLSTCQIPAKPHVLVTKDAEILTVLGTNRERPTSNMSSTLKIQQSLHPVLLWRLCN